MAERPHRRSGRRIVGRDRAILVHTQDLSRERGGVLSVRSILRVSGGDIELAIGAELHPPAVMIRVAGDAIEDDRLLGATAVVIPQAHHLVAGAPVRCRVAVVEVDESVSREVRVERDAEQTLLAVADRARREGRPWFGPESPALSELQDTHAAGALGDEQTPVRREVDGPRRDEPAGDELNVLHHGRPNARRGGRCRARARWRRGRGDGDRRRLRRRGRARRRARARRCEDHHGESQRCVLHARVARHSASSAGGMGGAMRKPCAVSKPIAATRSQVTASSTPTAVTRNPRSWAAATSAVAKAATR